MDDLSDFLAGLHGQLERCAAATAEEHATKRSSVWRVAAYGMACLVAAAVVLGVVFGLQDRVATHTGGSGTKAGSAPSPSRTRPGRIFAGRAPAVAGDDLTGMVRGLDGELWAWGYRHRQNGPGTPLLERWDGQSWQAVPTPPAAMAPGGEIDGVAALSHDDLWIAENTRRGGRLAHWDGASWTAVPAIDFVSTSETSNALLAVSPSDIWAVGSAAGTHRLPPSSRLRTLHWNGRRWRSVPALAFGRRIGDVSLRLIKGVSPDAVWALGDYQRYRRKTIDGKAKWMPTRSAQYLLFWDGRRWTRQPWPTRQPSNGGQDEIAIDDLAVSSDGQLWCAGRRWFGPDNSGDLFVPVVLRLRAARWEITASSATPSLPTDWKQFMPRSITATSSQDVWVVGQNDTASSLWRWDGSVWSVVDFGKDIIPSSKFWPEATTLFSARSVLAVAANDVWVLCQGGTVSDTLQQLEPFFLHFDGATWQRVPAAPDAGAQP